MLVGVPRNDSGANNSGAAFLFYGPVERGDVRLSEADATFVGASARDRAGFSVAGGDLDGDGYADVVVGAPFDDSGGEDAGAVYAVYGECPTEDHREETETDDRGTPTDETATETEDEHPAEETTEKTTKETTKTTHGTPETTETTETTKKTETTVETTTAKHGTETTETTETTTETTETTSTTETTEATETTTETTSTTETTTETTDTTTTETTETTTETTTDTTTTKTTTTATTTTTDDKRAAISFVAFCVDDGGRRTGNDPCPSGERLLVKFEWNGNAFAPEGGDPKGVTVTPTQFKDGDPSEPVAATWTSQQTVSTVVVKSGTETCTYGGGISGTVESCGPPPGQSNSRTGGIGGVTFLAGTAAAVGLTARYRDGAN